MVERHLSRCRAGRDHLTAQLVDLVERARRCLGRVLPARMAASQREHQQRKSKSIDESQLSLQPQYPPWLRRWQRAAATAYNPDMGPALGTQIDDWFRSGGIVVTASERAARSLAQAYHRRRPAEGLSAWPAPNIQAWTSLRTRVPGRDAQLDESHASQLRAGTAPMGRDHQHANPISPRLSTHRASAWPPWRWKPTNCCAHYAPAYLSAKSRASWEHDPGAFSGWLTAFEKACRENVCLSASRLPLDAVSHSYNRTRRARAPLSLVGFDRILPTQRALFDAWGSWQELEPTKPAAKVTSSRIADERSELDACALWCMQHLADHPDRPASRHLPGSSSAAAKSNAPFFAPLAWSSDRSSNSPLGSRSVRSRSVRTAHSACCAGSTTPSTRTKSTGSSPPASCSPIRRRTTPSAPHAHAARPRSAAPRNGPSNAL